MFFLFQNEDIISTKTLSARTILPRGFVICVALKRNHQEVNFERLRKNKHIFNIIPSKINKPINERKAAHSVCFQKLVISWHQSSSSLKLILYRTYHCFAVNKLCLCGDLTRKSKPSLYRTPSYSEMVWHTLGWHGNTEFRFCSRKQLIWIVGVIDFHTCLMSSAALITKTNMSYFVFI